MPSLYIVIPTIITMKLYNYKLPCHVDGLNKHVQYLLCDNKLELHGWLASSNMRCLKWPTKLGSYVGRKCWFFFFLMCGIDLQVIDCFFPYWKEKRVLTLVLFVFNEHLCWIESFAWSLPAAVCSPGCLLLCVGHTFSTRLFVVFFFKRFLTVCISLVHLFY